MADFFKGLSGGFQSGLQLSQAMRDREERDRLREIQDAAFTESQGYTAAQGRQLEGLANSGGYDIVPQYASPAEGQTQGLFTGYQSVPKANLQDQASWDMPAASQTYAPQRVTDFLGQRYEGGGLAPERMETIRTRAMANAVSDPRLRQQMLMSVTGEERAQEAEKRAKEDQAYQLLRRPLELENLQGGLKTQTQQQEAARLTIEQHQRQADEQANVLAARNELAAFRKEGPLTAAQIAEVSGKYKLDPTQFLKSEDAVNVQEIKDTKRMLSSAALKGEEGLNKFLADRFDPDKTDNIKPKIVKDKTGNLVVMYGDQVLADYGAHKNIMSLVGGIINVIDQNPHATLKTLSDLDTAEQTRNASAQAILASEAQIRASDSTVGLNTQRANQIKQMNAAMATNLKNSAEAKALESEYASLNDENDPGGAKRNSVLNQFNMLSVKAGGTIPLGGKQKTGLLSQPVEQKKNEDGTYTAFAKDGGRALYNTYNGEEIPLGMSVSDYQGLKDAAKKNGVSLVTGEDNGKLVVKFAGADGKYYDDAEKAKYAKPAPAEKPAAPALVKEDTTKYTRTKTPRGGYIYTVNPRTGRTKAEYAELDKK